MAKALYEQEIDKTVNWAGDEHTKGNPVSGQYVQKFIKDTLEQKYGYMEYMRDEKQYFVFADKTNYEKWKTDPVKFDYLKLFGFDAPAPATIEVRNYNGEADSSPDEIDRTVIKGDGIKQYLRFNYRILDRNLRPQSEAVLMKVTVAKGASSSTFTETFPAEPQNAASGVSKEVNIDQYIQETGDYTITVTLTGMTSQASTNIIFTCRVIELTFDVSFDNKTIIDNSKSWFNVTTTITGAPSRAKIVEMLIDGEYLYQNALGYTSNCLSTGDIITSQTTDTVTVSFYVKDKEGNMAKWPSAAQDYHWEGYGESFVLSNHDLAGKDIFSAGKHSMQMRIYIVKDDGTPTYSKTHYFEFVVEDPAIAEEQYHILYSTTMDSGNVFTEDSEIKITTEQYGSAEFTVLALSTRGSDVNVNYKLGKEATLPDGTATLDPVYKDETIAVPSGETGTLAYSFRDSGDMKLIISSPDSDDVIEVSIEVTPSTAKVSETTGAIYKYTAVNRSNEANKGVWVNESPNEQYAADAVFNENVMFINGQTGWDASKGTLTLKNQAAVTFPINIFKPEDIQGNQYSLQDSGLTFEVEFTTSNALSDDARILDYSDPVNGSYIKITATSAEIRSQKGATIKTNFKDNERIKLAFIINPIRQTTFNEDTQHWEVTKANAKGIDYPNTLMIMVNGVLDRACRWGDGDETNLADSFEWRNASGDNANSFTIGDLDGAVTVDLTAIRIYRKSLKFEEEFQNYMYDTFGSKLEEIYKANNILNATGEVDFELVRAKIPTMVIGIDYRGEGETKGINGGGLDAKKDNYQAEVQYYDNTDANLGFYARNVWISCQGTSSMNYPTKNLRIYFGKTANKATKSAIRHEIDTAGNDTGNNVPESIWFPDYATEFFPRAVYVGHEDEMSTYSDQILPYSTNKKVDGPDGIPPFKSNIVSNRTGEIHEGYHMVGSNLTAKGKFNILKNYVNIYDPFYVYDTEHKTFQDLKHIPEFYILKSDAKSIRVKDAWDDEYNIWSATKFKGYKYDEEAGAYSSSYKKAATDQFMLCHLDRVSDALINIRELIDPDTIDPTGDRDPEPMSLEKYLESGKNIYISAYRPLANSVYSFDSNGKSDALKKYEKELRYSGAKFYVRTETRDPETNEITNVQYSETGKKVALDDNTFYFSLGSYWRQYDEEDHVSGWTDRWTLKADFAESSMTHNAGVARLWGQALKLVSETNAQKAVGNIIDVRTSCDGKPIVLFTKQLKGYNTETGKPEYEPAKYAGLFNIMTDKSSTKLFGFEDIYDEKGKRQWKASSVQCWECLANGSGIPQGFSLAFDKEHPNETEFLDTTSNGDLGSDRLIFSAYESRFPDSGQERHEYDPSDTREAEAQAQAAGEEYEYAGGEFGNRWPDDTFGVETNSLESYLRWLNFCSSGIKYTIGKGDQTIDGYSGSLYNEIPAYDEADKNNTTNPTVEGTALYNYVKYMEAKAEYDRTKDIPEEKETADNAAKLMEKYNLYWEYESAGNTDYAGLGESIILDDEGNTMPVIFDPENLEEMKLYTWYSFASEIDYESVEKVVNNDPATGYIATDIYRVQMDSFDSKYRFRYKDEDGRWQKDEPLANEYKVWVYLTPTTGGQLKYVDECGIERITSFTALGINEDQYETDSNGRSWKGRRYIDYFNETWRDHLDPEKVAAYYVYMIRFGAVDQVVKNTMMTTEDGKRWYFINYDNDTVLGVRNDGFLKYNWDLDRNTFDYEVKSYAYAGAKSVLWNLLELCDDFMDLVKAIDNNLYENEYLSVEGVLEWLNEKQEHTWCERLYNGQEEAKYISTFVEDFEKTKYLSFMQGTRESHRTWWVNNRWNLYDSKWNTGLYGMECMGIYMGATAQTGKRLGTHMITAASNYTFKQASNNRMYEGWDVFLKKDENYLFELPAGVGNTTTSDPNMLYGPQKFKVINFRPINYNAAPDGTIGGTATLIHLTNWVAKSGSLLSKLLIGSNGSTTTKTVTNGITSLASLNEIYSLEEVDIRNCNELESISITKLNNLHRLRAKGCSKLTSIITAQGAIMYEMSLPETLNSLTLDSVTFKSDPAEYKEYQSATSIVKKWSVAKGDVEEVPMTSIDKYVDIVDALPPYNNIEAAFKYCKTYVEKDEETGLPKLVQTATNANDGYVFEYTPNSYLQTISFKNVVGLDTYAFIIDWYNALVAGNSMLLSRTITEDETGAPYRKYLNPISLEGIKWILPTANDLIRVHRLFTWNTSNGTELFKGNVYLQNITSEDYDRLIAEFGDGVFTAGNPLTVTSAPQVFFTVKSNQTPVFDGRIGKNVYEIVEGTKLDVKADIFPVSSTIDYVYSISVAEGSAAVNGINPGQPLNELDGKKNSEVYGIDHSTYGRGIWLTNSHGAATVSVDDSGAWTNALTADDGSKIFKIDVYGYGENGKIDYSIVKTFDPANGIDVDPIYVRVVKKQIPANDKFALVDITDEEEKPLTFSDKREHVLKLKMTDTCNIDIKSISMSFNNFSNPTSTSLLGSNANEIARISKGDAKNEFILWYDLPSFASRPAVPLYATVVFNDSTTTTRQLTFNASIICNPVQSILLKDSDENVISSSLVLNDLNVFEYTVYLLDASGTNDYNINYTVGTKWDGRGIPGMGISIDSTTGNLKLDTFNVISQSASTWIVATGTIIVEAVPESTNLPTVSRSIAITFEVRLPSRIELTRPDLTDGITPVKYSSGNFDIDLTINEHWDGVTVNGITPAPITMNLTAVDDSATGIETTVSGTRKIIDELTIAGHEIDIDALTSTPASITGTDFKIAIPTGAKHNVTVNSQVAGTSIDALELYISKPESFTGASDYAITMKCHAEYDDTVHDAINEPKETEQQTFEFHVRRSAHVSTKYSSGLANIDVDPNKYRLYLVDKYNRFFEFTAQLVSGNWDIQATFNTSGVPFTSVGHTPQDVTGNTADDWRGVGYLKNNKPYFISFVQYYRCQVCPSDNAIFPTAFSTGQPLASWANDASYAADGKGWEATQAFAASNYAPNIFNTVYNKYDGAVRLYVPTFEESKQLFSNGLGEDNNTYDSMPGEQTLALNALIAYLVRNTFINGIEIIECNPSIEYDSDQLELDKTTESLMLSNRIGMSASDNLFGNGTNNRIQLVTTNCYVDWNINQTVMHYGCIWIMALGRYAWNHNIALTIGGSDSGELNLLIPMVHVN